MTKKSTLAKMEIDLGFMSRTLAQIGMPHSKLDTHYFERTSGLVTLSINAHPKIGLPYGTYPRLLLSWICTEAVKTQNPVLQLGTNQTEFLKKLKIARAGSTIHLLKDQTNRLLSSLFRLDYNDENVTGFKNLILSTGGFEFWSPNTGEWETQFKLSEEFFNEVINNPVPIDLNVLHSIRKSPMTMDVYTWLTYRSYSIYKKGGRPIKISWTDLQSQFGASFGQNIETEILTSDEILKKEAQALSNFRKRFLVSIQNLSLHYPDISKIINADSQFLTIGGAKLIPDRG